MSDNYDELVAETSSHEEDRKILSTLQKPKKKSLMRLESVEVDLKDVKQGLQDIIKEIEDLSSIKKDLRDFVIKSEYLKLRQESKKYSMLEAIFIGILFQIGFALFISSFRYFSR